MMKKLSANLGSSNKNSSSVSNKNNSNMLERSFMFLLTCVGLYFFALGGWTLSNSLLSSSPFYLLLGVSLLGYTHSSEIKRLLLASCISRLPPWLLEYLYHKSPLDVLMEPSALAQAYTMCALSSTVALSSLEPQDQQRITDQLPEELAYLRRPGLLHLLLPESMVNDLVDEQQQQQHHRQQQQEQQQQQQQRRGCFVVPRRLGRGAGAGAAATTTTTRTTTNDEDGNENEEEEDDEEDQAEEQIGMATATLATTPPRRRAAAHVDASHVPSIRSSSMAATTAAARMARPLSAYTHTHTHAQPTTASSGQAATLPIDQLDVRGLIQHRLGPLYDDIASRVVQPLCDDVASRGQAMVASTVHFVSSGGDMSDVQVFYCCVLN